MTTPEGRVKKACRRYLHEIGCYRFSPVQMGYGTRTLDDLVCWRGRFIGIEYKRAGGVQKGHQHLTALQITTAGGIALLIENVDQLIEYFQMLEPGMFRASEALRCDPDAAP